MSGAGPNAEGGMYVQSSAMASTIHPHTARLIDRNKWEVSYLPGQTFTTKEAVCAMAAADLFATRGVDPAKFSRDELSRVSTWASMLGLITSQLFSKYVTATPQ